MIVSGKLLAMEPKDTRMTPLSAPVITYQFSINTDLKHQPVEPDCIWEIICDQTEGYKDDAFVPVVFNIIQESSLVTQALCKILHV